MDIVKIFAQYGIIVTDFQKRQFENFYRFLVQENEKYNLTAITDAEGVMYKHFLDSALPYQEFNRGATVIDIGSGASFPAIPLKILRPDLKFTLVDSLQKRVNFLTTLVKLLKLDDVEVVHARAEDFIKGRRESFDYAVARAVAPLNTLLEYMVPYLKVGGRCVIYKSQKLEEEVMAANNALWVMSAKIIATKEYDLQGAERKVLLVEKMKETDKKYPRGKNQPKQKPL